jgi:type IV secretion system protein VirB8
MLFKKKLEKTFAEEGNDWYVDRYETIKVERNRYFILLLVALAALIVSLIIHVAILPLKTAVPYVIEIDKTTGITTVLKGGDMNAVRSQQAVTDYFLLKYLNARMSYDWGLRQENANIVRALSTRSVYQTYVDKIDVNNPQSPIKLYDNSKIINVHVTSHTMPYPNIAEIHFYTEITDKVAIGVTAPVKQYWIATVKFTYADNALTTEDRENINPLGFFVTDFQLNHDVPGGNTL